MAVDIGALIDIDYFKTQVDRLIRSCRSSERAEGFSEIVMPGERASGRRARPSAVGERASPCETKTGATSCASPARWGWISRRSAAEHEARPERAPAREKPPSRLQNRQPILEEMQWTTTTI